MKSRRRTVGHVVEFVRDLAVVALALVGFTSLFFIACVFTGAIR